MTVEGYAVWCELPDGRKHGALSLWYPSGAFHGRMLYDYGLLENSGITLFENGQKAWEGDAKTGLQKRWYENGQKEYEGRERDDIRDGPWVWWFPNGEKMKEGQYKTDIPDGEWRYYNESGDLVRIDIWHDGELVQSRPEAP